MLPVNMHWLAVLSIRDAAARTWGQPLWANWPQNLQGNVCMEQERGSEEMQEWFFTYASQPRLEILDLARFFSVLLLLLSLPRVCPQCVFVQGSAFLQHSKGGQQSGCCSGCVGDSIHKNPSTGERGCYDIPQSFIWG